MKRTEAFQKDNEFVVQYDSNDNQWVVIGDETKFVYESCSNKFTATKAAKKLTLAKEKK